jgi:hypothetical protein
VFGEKVKTADSVSSNRREKILFSIIEVPAVVTANVAVTRFVDSCRDSGLCKTCQFFGRPGILEQTSRTNGSPS